MTALKLLLILHLRALLLLLLPPREALARRRAAGMVDVVGDDNVGKEKGERKKKGLENAADVLFACFFRSEVIFFTSAFDVVFTASPSFFSRPLPRFFTKKIIRCSLSLSLSFSLSPRGVVVSYPPPVDIEESRSLCVFIACKPKKGK